MFKKVAGLALLSAVAGGAMAQAYVGIGLGQTHVSKLCDTATTGVACHDNDFGVKAYGGYAIDEMIAAELGYIKFGKATLDAGTAHAELEGRAFTVGAALRMAFTPTLGGVVRAGLAKVKVEDRATTYVGGSTTSTQPYLGLGLEYSFEKSVKGTLAYDRTRAKNIRGETGSVSLLSAGLQYGF
jgi:opacity protein-like surface antigen